MANLKVVLFDYGGTLDANGTTWRERFFRIYKSVGLNIEKERFEQAFYRSDDFLTEKRLKKETLRETLKLQIRGVMEDLNGFTASKDNFINYIADLFHEETLQNIRENKNTLERLKNKYRLGIISNFYGNLAPICAELGISKYFDIITDSAVAGVTKPDPAIFKLTLNDLAVSAEEAVFVGDSRERDMAGAHAIGMDHILLVNNKKKNERISPCCSRGKIIHKLSELELIL